MSRLGRVIVYTATVAVAFAGTALADMYPIAPPGASVTLYPRDFIYRVLEASSPWLLGPNPVIGDNLGQHPGGLGGDPELGTFFVGVFADRLDTNGSVYLWETTGGPHDVAFTGPQIQLGYWDGVGFTPYGNPQTASYLGTGVYGGDIPDLREINSSVIPLSAFGISSGLLNAVRIEAVSRGSENQVTAVAITTVPEPSSMLLVGTCIVGLLSRSWYVRKQARH